MSPTGGSLFVSRLFVDNEDEDFRNDVLIEFDKDGIITRTEEDAFPSDVSDSSFRFLDGIATPAFVNSHTHVMDNIGKGLAVGRVLDDVVGANGLKFKILASHIESELQHSLKLALTELTQTGTGLFFDFREGGLNGVLILKKTLENFNGLDARILGRPTTMKELDELCRIADGLGLATPNLYSDDELAEICDVAKKYEKILATHLMESTGVVKESKKAFGKSDLERTVEFLEPDIVVHLTQATSSDLDLISSVAKLLVFCPRSNAFFGLGFPPVYWCLENRVPFGLGSDNALTTPLDVLGDVRWLILRIAESRQQLFTKDLLIECYRAITRYPAMQLNLNYGLMKLGYLTSLIIWDAKSPRLNPCNNFLEHLLLRSSKKDIVQVFLRGIPQL